MKVPYSYFIVAVFAIITLSGCHTVQNAATLATSVGTTTGVIDTQQAAAIQKSVAALAKTFEDFTPEQQYYIGRSVGAVVLSRYKPYQNDQINQYINLLGQTLAQASDMPEIFNGYHFLVLDSADINAFATPSGLVFVTRGMLECCQTEDALAAVLAHEIAHIQLKHGLQAINRERITYALTTTATEGAKAFGSQELAEMTKNFEDSIMNITSTMINNGYSRAFEYQADQSAVVILRRIGYDPHALVEMLMAMGKHLKPGGADFAKTHPSPQSRIEKIEKLTGSYKKVAVVEQRQARFLRMIKRL
jgi:predicted Zn-dependent protease